MEADLQLQRGVALVKQGQLREAAAAFALAITSDPTLLSAYRNLALVYFELKDPQAFNALLIAIYLYPQDASLYQKINQIKIIAFADVDVVFYTGTPFLKPFNAELGFDQALGGSESALIAMASGYAKRGLKVICFANVSHHCTVAGVNYYPCQYYFLFNHVAQSELLIISRFLYPLEFVPLHTKKIYLWLHEIMGVAEETEAPLLKNLAPQVEKVFLLSQFQAQRVQQEYQIPSDKIVLTRNGIDPLFFEQAPQKQVLALVYLSRPERGLAVCLAVFQRLALTLPELTLHICGYSPYDSLVADPAYQCLLDFITLHPKLNIKLHGALSKSALAKLLSTCSLCLYPNITELETSCIAAMECMAAGVPLVTSDRGALPETVPHQVGGVIVPYEDGAKSFQDRLFQETLALLKDSELLPKLATSARNYANKHYLWDEVLSQWLTLQGPKLTLK